MVRCLGRPLVVAGCVLALCPTAGAVVPRGHRLEAPALTALPSARLSKPLREHKKLVWGQSTPSFAWNGFTARRLGSWQAAWDVATGVPSRIWGEGIPAPGSIADPAIAERIARGVLSDHLALLAPGARLEDFVLASNHFDGEMRSIGFFQQIDGRRVVGGQVSFRFKADRLFVIGSEALPHVKVVTPRSRLAANLLRTRAAAILRDELALAGAPVSDVGDEVIVPLVADDAVLGYRVARPLEIDGGYDGRYLAYADVTTGEIVAVRQLNTYASNGRVLYDTVDRYPARGRISRPASRAHVTVNGVSQTTSLDGSLSWTGGAVEVVTGVIGDLVTVYNKATGNAAASAIHPLSPGGALVWNASASAEDEAQLNTYVTTMIAKEYVRDHVDPNMPTLDDQMLVNVNIGQSCNAFFDGKSINFFQSSTQCENTGLLEDVVYHEYGHRLHTAEIIPGVGDFDGSVSEGASDFLAASITGDPGMGRGFFFSDAPLRDLDPPDSEWMWPRDIGEIHRTGQIYGGIFWDLRKALIAKHGEAQGVAVVNKLYLATLRRSINIPSSLVEALAADDDDGNLANGSPNECEIREAFGRHGLRTATGTVRAPGQLTVNALAIGVHIDVTGLSERCDGDEIVGAELSWQPPYGDVPRSGTAQATPAGGNTYFAQLPLTPQDSVYYKARVKFPDGSSLILADNLADPFYQLYQGETVKLYCTSFDTTDPFSEGWTTGTDDGSPSPFQWGVPTFGATDPPAAFSGSKILAQTLDGDYLPRQRAWLKTPPVDVGRYSDVRLHYRRWLAVEDSHFDTAMITANGKKAWVNYTGNLGDHSAMHHVDKEWRFHDVPLSGYFRGHSVTVGWEIKSDGGLELGGWHLDDVCIVANPHSICGDGVKTRTEQCDAGLDNRNQPDTCRSDCRLPSCGDGIVDSTEECDEGPDGNFVCSAACKLIPPADSGCCSAGAAASPGALGLAGVVFGLVVRRRRRHR
jgi:MYXO-CTERM domain-containing protein